MNRQDDNLDGNRAESYFGTRFSLDSVVANFRFKLVTLWPNYNRDVALRIGAARELSSAEIRNLLIEQTLLKNLSVLLEPNFRRELCRVLQSWNLDKISFSAARQQLDELLDKRSHLAVWTIPAYPLARLLISFGFFSSSAKLMGSSRFGSRVTIRRIVSLLRLALATKPTSLLSVLSDFRAVNSWRLGALSNATVEFLAPRASYNNETMPSEKSLIVGPAPFDHLPESPFQRTFVLINENSTPEDLSLPSVYGEVSAVFRGRMSRKILSLTNDHCWIRTLQNASDIFLEKKYVKPIQRKLGRPVSPLRGHLMHMWGSAGNPNLFQAALATCLAAPARGGQAEIVVAGVTLYSGQSLYARGSSGLRTERSAEVFRTCQALANHDPVSNFQVPRAMVRAGLISGSQQFLEIANSTTHAYLSSLDENLGMLRK